MKNFLYRSLGNLVIDEYRKKKPLSLDDLHEQGFDPGKNDTESMQNQLDGARAIESLKELPEEYREVIFMRFVQELSLKEIAKITGDSENSVAVKIHRGIKKAQKIFNHEQ